MCCIKIALRRSFFEKTVQSIANGTDKGGSFVTVVRLETKLRATLTEQQKALFEQIKKTDAEITTGMSYKRSQTDFDVDKFIGLAKKYTRITELTPEILHTFVSKIVIHERRERFKQNTEQQIDIYFRYIGNTAGL